MKKIYKKAQDSGALKVIVGAILILFVAAVLLFVFRNGVRDQTAIIDDSVCGLNSDIDNDGVIDTIDTCLCEDETQCDTVEGRRACREKKERYCDNLK